MSDLSKYCVHLLGKEELGLVRGGFSISNYVVYRAVMAVWVGILYHSGDFDFVCFIPSKSQTIMVTCSGYSISVPDTSVVGYHTAPRGVHRIFQRGFPKKGYACDMLCTCVYMVRASPMRSSQ